MDPQSSSKPSQPSTISLFRRLWMSGTMAVVFTVLPPTGSLFLLASLTHLGPWLREHGALALVYYFVCAGLLMGLSLLPTYACSILAGFAFGIPVGTPLATVTVTFGGLLAYWIGRRIAQDRVVAVINDYPKWRAVHQTLLAGQSGQTRLVVALLRIPPLSPFGLTNFILAATKVPFRDYSIGTCLGVIPRNLAGCAIGAALNEINFEKPSWLITGGSIALVLMCVLLGVLANRALRNLTGEDRS